MSYIGDGIQTTSEGGVGFEHRMVRTNASGNVMRAVLLRLCEEERKQTLGILQVFEGTELKYSCKTLEPAWKWNQPNVSCIPDGSYILKKRSSDKYGEHFHILQDGEIEILDRSFVLMHYGNFRKNTKGCILPGQGYYDIDKDGLRDVTSSKKTIHELLSHLPDVTSLSILSVFQQCRVGLNSKCSTPTRNAQF